MKVSAENKALIKDCIKQYQKVFMIITMVVLMNL
jgi:hypothetical protein